MSSTNPITTHREQQFLQGVRTSLSVLGGKWKLLIIAHLVSGTRRYGELKRLMPEITEKMLIQQLRELERDGIVTRTTYPTIPPKVEYAVSEYGTSICTVVESLYQWGSQHTNREQAAAEKMME